MVRKSDFNKNLVVSLDLDLDFDLGFVNMNDQDHISLLGGGLVAILESLTNTLNIKD